MSEVKVNKISPRIDCGTVTVGDSGDSVSVTAGVPVTVNGDLKSNALKAVDGGSIISQCGTTITLGASGDTINLAAGATQTGFGRTGTVDWDTTAKTASFTAVSGNGYFVNTTSGAITVTLPASPSAGDIVSLADYTNTWQTNNVTVARNGSKIGGNAGDATLNTEGQSVTFVYVDGTEGWKNVQDSTSNVSGIPPFIEATGGTITTCGDYKIHTFTGPGTFCVSRLAPGPSGNPNNVDYLVVAGGGGGGYYYGSGGGAGGFRESHCASVSGCYTASPLATPSGIPVSVTGYPIAIGAGGSSSPVTPAAGGNGAAGNNSTFSTITSAGGGGGGAGTGGNGGSGGGGSQSGSGGTGNTPPVSPPQGNNGGPAPGNNGGGGGGATAVGEPGGGTKNGGAGAGTNINPATGESGPGCLQYYAGGGAGNGNCGGIGGGGNYGQAGDVNTGGGAGGDSTPAAGGSGIVIIRYKYQ